MDVFKVEDQVVTLKDNTDKIKVTLDSVVNDMEELFLVFNEKDIAYTYRLKAILTQARIIQDYTDGNLDAISKLEELVKEEYEENK